MNTTFWNLARKIAEDMNTVQLGFAMLLGYMQGSETAAGEWMEGSGGKILPQITHIEEEEKEDMRLKYGDGSITSCRRRRKDGSVKKFYQGRIYINGRQQAVYASTVAECKQKLDALRAERKKLELQPDEPQFVSATYSTYGSYLDDWLKLCKNGKIKKAYKPELEKYVARVKEALGDIKLKALQPLDILNYVARLPRCNNTVKLYDVINGSLRKAEDFGIIKKNPCKAVDRPTYEKASKRPFELWEQRAVLDELQGKHKRLFFFMCCTGLRVGEVIALEKSSINFERCYINVVADADLDSGERDTVKTKNSLRRVYFAPQLFDTFDIEELGTFTYSGIKKAFVKAYKKLKLAPGISLTHSCRHTYASMLSAVDVPPKVIQAQMGHASVMTTLDTYTDLLAGGGSSPVYEYVKILKEFLREKFL